MMNNMEIRNFVEKVCASIENNTEFYLGTLTCDDATRDWRESKSLFTQPDFIFQYGATKGVFIPKDLTDYVVKFDFDELESSYCFHEFDTYNTAKEQNLDRYFAETRLLGSFQNNFLYAQEYVRYSCEDLLIDTETIVSENFIQHISEKMQDTPCTCSLPMEWCAKFIDLYGEKELDRLFKFLEDRGVNDLHSGNVGYLSDKRPIIFDYSGYYEDL